MCFKFQVMCLRDFEKLQFIVLLSVFFIFMHETFSLAAFVLLCLHSDVSHEQMILFLPLFFCPHLSLKGIWHKPSL